MSSLGIIISVVFLLKILSFIDVYSKNAFIDVYYGKGFSVFKVYHFKKRVSITSQNAEDQT